MFKQSYKNVLTPTNNSLHGRILISSEIRNWVLFVFAIVGVVITLRTYKEANEQNKIENTFKTLDFMKSHIQEEQIETFKVMFHANSVAAGRKPNEFVFPDGRKDDVEYMFAEGGSGNGDIHNMIEIFNLVAPTLNDLDIGIIWYEYGQIMSVIYRWTSILEESEEDDSFRRFYSEFNLFMRENREELWNRPVKYYTYQE